MQASHFLTNKIYKLFCMFYQLTNFHMMSFCKPFRILQAYANAGAFIQEDLSEASVIFGVKQVPVDSLQRDKTFCFFSHTIKVRLDLLFDFACKYKNHLYDVFDNHILLHKSLGSTRQHGVAGCNARKERTTD